MACFLDLGLWKSKEEQSRVPGSSNLSLLWHLSSLTLWYQHPSNLKEINRVTRLLLLLFPRPQIEVPSSLEAEFYDLYFSLGSWAGLRGEGPCYRISVVAGEPGYTEGNVVQHWDWFNFIWGWDLQDVILGNKRQMSSERQPPFLGMPVPIN